MCFLQVVDKYETVNLHSIRMDVVKKIKVVLDTDGLYRKGTVYICFILVVIIEKNETTYLTILFYIDDRYRED